MLLYTLIAALAAVQTAYSDPEIVDCPNLQTSCSCSVGQTECEFELRIDYHDAFVSYELGPNRELRGIGSKYILDPVRGYRSAFRGVKRACNFGDDVTLLKDEDFISRGCSPPITADGVSEHGVLVINGITPGPTLIMDYGATVLMRVVNNLQENTSIHWHGMFQYRSPWMDGVGGLTEPSIQAGTTFTYIFKARPHGTHWYHSHVGLQRTDGMYAALVVRGQSLNTSEIIPEDSNAVIVDRPGDFTFSLIDWQSESSSELFKRAKRMGFTRDRGPSYILRAGQPPLSVIRGVNSDGSDLGPIPFFSALINGKGRYQNTITPLSEFTVESNTYVLMRVVGAIDRTAQTVSIDNHRLRVIATDGHDVEYVDVDFISVQAGERYDFLVHTTAAPGHYWIRAESHQVNVPPGQEFSARAILSYENAATTLDWRNGYSDVRSTKHECTPGNPCLELNCDVKRYGVNSDRICVSLLDLVPRPRKPQEDLPSFPPSSSCPDCMHFLNFDFAGEDGSPSVNTHNLVLPTLAYQTNCGQYDIDNSPGSSANTCAKNCTEGGCECINVIPLANERNYNDDRVSGNLESVAFVFSSYPSITATHPIHMHGHSFHVLYIGYGTYDDDGELIERTEDIVCEDPCINPRWKGGSPPDAVLNRTVDGKVTNAAIQKDTVVIPAGGYVVVAIKADNPGYWYLHCHIESHTHGGMIIILQEYAPDQQWFPPPGINDASAGFTWTIEEFDAHVAEGLTCAEEEAPTDVAYSKHISNYIWYCPGRYDFAGYCTCRPYRYANRSRKAKISQGF